MHPVVTFMGLSVPAYSLMIIIGVVCGYAAICGRGALFAMASSEVAAVYVLAAAGSFLGAKAFFVVQGLPAFLATNKSGLEGLVGYINQAGLVFYGGMFGCFGFIWIASRSCGIPYVHAANAVLPALPLAQSFGRVGCLLAGCCYGVPSRLGFYMNESEIAPHDVRLFPVQLAESACTFALFLLLMRTTRKYPNDARSIALYLLFYGLSRFALEFLRYDEIRGHLGTFSVSQWISVACVAAGIVLWCKRVRAVSQSEPRFLKY